RDYDAATGRWTAKDPIGFRGGATSLYLYVGNNPVGFFDPSGLQQAVPWCGPAPPPPIPWQVLLGLLRTNLLLSPIVWATSDTPLDKDTPAPPPSGETCPYVDCIPVGSPPGACRCSYQCYSGKKSGQLVSNPLACPAKQFFPGFP
ncbi:MAG TPA: RHS repeat-associated core domain-containing protein, partial [Polyangiaceae bacterium]|nr:RHS repeat-associated core domain-containing protein [Polyangiaceae bacterium]